MFFICFIFAFHFGLAYFSLLVSFVLSSFLQFFPPSVTDELSCSVASPDCGMLRTLVISGVKKYGTPFRSSGSWENEWDAAGYTLANSRSYSSRIQMTQTGIRYVNGQYSFHIPVLSGCS